MSGEDRAVVFFGSDSRSLEAFNLLKNFLDEVCPDVRISIQGSLLAFKTNAGFAYVSLPSGKESTIIK